MGDLCPPASASPSSSLSRTHTTKQKYPHRESRDADGCRPLYYHLVPNLGEVPLSRKQVSLDSERSTSCPWGSQDYAVDEEMAALVCQLLETRQDGYAELAQPTEPYLRCPPAPQQQGQGRRAGPAHTGGPMPLHTHCQPAERRGRRPCCPSPLRQRAADAITREWVGRNTSPLLVAGTKGCRRGVVPLQLLVEPRTT
jgi:hypothetical protein